MSADQQDELLRIWEQLSPGGRMILKGLALTTLYPRRSEKTKRAWMCIHSEPLIIGDQRDPRRSRPGMGRRASDKMQR